MGPPWGMHAICASTPVRVGTGAEGLIARNPCDKVKLPAEQRSEMIFLDAGWLRELAEAMDPWRRALADPARTQRGLGPVAEIDGG